MPLQRRQLAIVVSALLWRHISGVTDYEERLIGWKGESYHAEGEPEPTAATTLHSLHSSNETQGQPWIQLISWKPRAAIYHNFLSDRECKHIIDLAHGQMQRSEVGGETAYINNIRTSYGTFLRRNYDPIIAAIEERVAIWSHFPVSHQEDMQVLRYGPTNKYGAHMDGQKRSATVLMYLVEPDEGGETTFVNSEWLHPEVGRAMDPQFSDCAKGHVAMKPKRGDALIFFDRMPDYVTDDIHTEHTGCPVLKGVKWNAVKWIHGEVFHPEEWEKSRKDWAKSLPDPGVCADYHAGCEGWAASGECEKNPNFMLSHRAGSAQGMCRKACSDCDVCSQGDTACFKSNRQRAGYLDFDPTELKGLELLDA
ncbi:hypothetical protein HYH03_006263 [Edaphochlamys debaryana]|uniref:Fe2OG dioxygenase domain-containing protein n=1 Tax=Edaphochlamys debaryana TaxID=47281 RepID=A0A835Y490_9CHLO|nr:hypothetical protein HYH03_006263 [Edaphochlamys debaryana]|eukprot:KAG2495663.1 hypothetical protein HYH03_006263 [Edaphochlamys debaryana]